MSLHGRDKKEKGERKWEREEKRGKVREKEELRGEVRESRKRESEQSHTLISLLIRALISS